MRSRSLRILSMIVVVTLGLALLAVACNGGGEDVTDGDGEETAVAVSLIEFAVELDGASAPAGTVTFSVTNDGVIVHDFLVIQTELDPGALPVDDETFAVVEAELNVVASSVNVEAGESAEVAADLEPGSYVLLCNIPTHYEAGMVTAFTVE